MVYLIAAAIWFVFGAFLIVYHELNPQVQAGRIWTTQVSIGWVALLLSGYNVFRWSQLRSQARYQQMLMEHEMRMQRERIRRHDREDEPSEPDPNFVFTDPPPADNEEQKDSIPPSAENPAASEQPPTNGQKESP